MSDIGVIGMLTYKLDKESLWVTPTLLDCQNQLQGQLFDEICDDNTIVLSDMQEKAIRFMKESEHMTSSGDFHFFIKTHSSGQDILDLVPRYL